MTHPDPFTNNLAMDALMSQYDQFGRARADDLSDLSDLVDPVDPYASEEALSVALADRAEFLAQLINKTSMTDARRSLLLTTLRAIRLDKAAPEKLDRLQTETLGIFERPLDLVQQSALAIAGVMRLREHPGLTVDQRAEIAGITDHLTRACAPVIVSATANS